MRLNVSGRSLAVILCGLIWLSALSSTSCQRGETREADPSHGVQPAIAPTGAAAEHAEPDPPKIVALGDSLTAGLGLDVEEAYPAVLQERIDEAGYSYQVVNAGVSGDTTAGGLLRVGESPG